MANFRNRSLSKFEFALAIMMITVLMWVFVNRIDSLAHEAERYRVLATVSNLSSGLMLEATHSLVRADHEAIARLATRNPLAMVGYVPQNYKGEIDYGQLSEATDGAWYYEPKKQWVIYRYAYAKSDNSPADSLENPQFTSHERTLGGNDGSLIAFRVRLRFQDVNEDNLFTPSSDVFEGVGLYRVQ